MADVMLHATAAHGRVFRADMPWQVATMVTGGGWASLALAPLVVVGAWVVLRGSRGARGAAIALAVVLLVLWAGLRSAALEDRFFVWLVPGRRLPGGRGRGPDPGAGRSWPRPRPPWPRPPRSRVAPGYTADPTGYRAAAARAAGGRRRRRAGCVVGSTGVQPMLAYLDQGVDFTAVTDPSGLDGCDVLVVATWWPTTAEWFAQDRRVIDAAEGRFAHRLVIGPGDRALVLSPVPAARGGPSKLSPEADDHRDVPSGELPPVVISVTKDPAGADFVLMSVLQRRVRKWRNGIVVGAMAVVLLAGCGGDSVQAGRTGSGSTTPGSAPSGTELADTPAAGETNIVDPGGSPSAAGTGIGPLVGVGTESGAGVLTELHSAAGRLA